MTTTNKFGCDSCDATVEYDENTALISKGEKLRDLCPECAPIVCAFIDERKAESNSKPQESEPLVLVKAMKMMKDSGYVYYKRERKKKRNE